MIVPDLAVEVVSHHDLYTEIQAKVESYLRDGVRLVWVVDPQRSKVTVYEGSQFKTLGQDEVLSGADVLPGLEIELVKLFQDVK